MELDNQTKVLLVLGVSFVLLYLLYVRNQPVSKKENMGNLSSINIDDSSVDSVPSMQSMPSSGSVVSKTVVEGKPPVMDYVPPESDWLYKKFDSKNKARFGTYKSSSYDKGNRVQGPSDWGMYFDKNNNLIGNAQTGANDSFLPTDETNDKLAVFPSNGKTTCGSNQNCEVEDLYDVDKYLPQEVNSDWFETVAEPISIRNRALINVTRPIGVNTIGSSKKNATYDLRAAPINAKLNVSPWNISSIEPDTNGRSII